MTTLRTRFRAAKLLRFQYWRAGRATLAAALAAPLTMVEGGMTDLALLVLRVVTGGLLMEPEQTPGSADERTAPAEAA